MAAKLIRIAAVLALSLAPAAATAQAQPRTPGYWAAVGAGGGVGNISCDGCRQFEQVAAGMGSVGFGWTVSPRIDVAVDASGWIRPGDGTTTRIGQVLAGVRYYPLSSGFFAGASIGWSRYLQKLDPMDEPPQAPERVEASGVAFRGSLGWALRAGRNLSIVPTVSYAVAPAGPMKLDDQESNFELSHRVLAIGATIEWRFWPAQ